MIVDARSSLPRPRSEQEVDLPEEVLAGAPDIPAAPPELIAVEMADESAVLAEHEPAVARGLPDPTEITEFAEVVEVVDKPDAADRRAGHDLLVRLADLADGPDRQALREQVVRQHLPLVRYLARRFRGRGEALDDLVQVGTIGLLKAVDRFDPGRGVEFAAFATPTIVGEVKRHFRDRAWAIKVPRKLQDHVMMVSRASGELFQLLSRSPTVDELAEHTGLSEEDVLEALESAHAYSTLSLDADVEEGTKSAAFVAVDTEMEGVEYRAALRPLLDRLPDRERQILVLRFFVGMTQSEIAAEVGVSQMHVSRLLARTLAGLRESLLAED